jgi:hypothetical protein
MKQGKDLIKYIRDNKMQDKDVNVLVSDGVFVSAYNIESFEISDPQTDDCVFIRIDMRPYHSFEERCRECWIYLHPECYPGPLHCSVSTICKKQRHIKPTIKDKKLLKKAHKEDVEVSLK